MNFDCPIIKKELKTRRWVGAIHELPLRVLGCLRGHKIFAKKNPQQGFTLLEIMISLSILAISLLALYSAVGNSLRASGYAQQTNEAVLLSRQKMAEVMISLDQDIARGAFPDEKEEQGTFEKPFEKYKWSYNIRKVQLPLIQLSAEQSAITVAPDDSKGNNSSNSNQGASLQSLGGIGNAANSMAQIVTKKISESLRQLQVTVTWGDEEDNLEKLTLTTHLAKLR